MLHLTVYLYIVLIHYVDCLAVSQTGKPFKHDVIYKILEKGLPKYELVQNTMDARVVRALFFYDAEMLLLCEEDANAERDKDGDEVVDNNAGVVLVGHSDTNTMRSCSVNGRPVGLTPRPIGGKKKAKLALNNVHSDVGNKKAKNTGEDTTAMVADAMPSLKMVLKHSQSVSLERMAMAIEAKANIAREQLMFNFFSSNPTHAASVAWFEKKAAEFTGIEAVTMAAPAPAAVPPIVTIDRNDGAIESDGTPSFDSVGVDNHPGVIEVLDDDDDDDDSDSFRFRTPVAVKVEVVAGSSAIVDVANSLVSLFDNGNSSQDSLPPTQNLFAALHNLGHGKEDNQHDSQETTL